MIINERNCLLWMSHIKTFRENDAVKLLGRYGSAVGVYEALRAGGGEAAGAEREKLVKEKLIKAATAEEISELTDDRWYERLMEKMELSGVKAVTISDEDYPERLGLITNPPLVLFCKGKQELLESEHMIAMIGSRRPTHYGASIADEFSKALATRGFTIVSGMAMGIDARSHEGVLAVDGKTIAVLGGGVDICYPLSNFDIYEDICEKGLLVSEYEPGEAHVAIHFPARNRIISGLSDAVLVVEAALRSGTLITTDYALEQGKEIYAIPGRVSDMMSRGVNNLIKQGAMLVDSPADIIIDHFGLTDKSGPGEASAGATAKPTYILSKSQQRILGLLGYEPVYIDDIIRANNMDISDTLHQLNVLKEMGYIRVLEQSYYVLNK